MEVQDFYEKLDQLYETNDLQQVEAYLAQIADTGVSCCGRISELSLACLNEQGSLYRTLGDYEQSVLCFETALDHLVYQYGSGSFESVTTRSNLAGTLRQKGDYEQAIQHLNTCLSMIRENHLDDPYLFASILNTLALVEIDRKDYVSALDHLNESVEQLVTLPETEMDRGIAAVNLSIIHVALGDLTEATNKITEALEILKQYPENAHYWSALNQQAGLLFQAGQFSQAKEAYMGIKEKLYKRFGRNLEYAISCFNLSRVEDKLANTKQAVEMATEAFETCRLILGEEHARTIQTRNWLRHLVD